MTIYNPTIKRILYYRQNSTEFHTTDGILIQMIVKIENPDNIGPGWETYTLPHQQYTLGLSINGNAYL